MKDASFVFVDEFDAFYHFELAYEVCKRLFAQSCQVILTTHNTSLMTNNLLRPDCYYLIDGKNVKPLNKCTLKESCKLTEFPELPFRYTGRVSKVILIQVVLWRQFSLL